MLGKLQHEDLGKRWGGVVDRTLRGATCYYLTSVLVYLGVVFGHDFLRPSGYFTGPTGDYFNAFLHWDGRNYNRIMLTGYSYSPEDASTVAFFPLYPLIARALMVVSGCSSEEALLLVSNCFLALAFIQFVLYTGTRLANAPAGAADAAVLAFGFFPTTFFFRMAYSESLFVFLAVLALYAMERRWPLVWIAVIIGLATAARPVAVALVPVFALHLFRQTKDSRRFAFLAATTLPLALGGLIAYMIYQYYLFHQPLAFAQTQDNFRVLPRVSWEEKLIRLLLLEPIWGTFVPTSKHFWLQYEPHRNPLFSLWLANPVYFAFTGVLLTLGAWKRWLTAYETVLGVGLLAIPYVTRGYDNCMLSFGRFSAVVFPAYLVMGLLLAHMPAYVKALLLGISAFFLITYSALFAVGYMVF